MKEGGIMPENESPVVPTGDIPNSWGFHLLQELRRMEDHLESKIDATNARIDATNVRIDTMAEKLDAKIGTAESKLDAKIDTLESKLDARFDAQDAKFQVQMDGLRYWSWGAILVVIAAAVATILTILFHH